MASSVITHYYDLAHKSLSYEDYEGCLSHVRKFVEAVVKTMCDYHGIPYDTKKTDDDATTFALINQLIEVGALSEVEADVFHKTRIMGNSGSHVDNVNQVPEVDLNEVKSAIDNMDFILDVANRFEKNKKTIATGKKQRVYEPIQNPDYYGSSRKYRGKWSLAITKEQVLMNKDYTQLKDKADNGDIQAMLDLAIGFVSDRSDRVSWGEKSRLINMPTAIDRNGEKHNNRKCQDFRYYYWVSRAVQSYIDKYTDGYNVSSFVFDETDPCQQYIATAFFDCLTFNFFITTGLLDSINYFDPAQSRYVDNLFPSTIAKRMFEYEEFPTFVSDQFILIGDILSTFAERFGPNIVSEIQRKEDCRFWWAHVKEAYSFIIGVTGINSFMLNVKKQSKTEFDFLFNKKESEKYCQVNDIQRDSNYFDKTFIDEQGQIDYSLVNALRFLNCQYNYGTPLMHIQEPNYKGLLTRQRMEEQMNMNNSVSYYYEGAIRYLDNIVGAIKNRNHDQHSNFFVAGLLFLSVLGICGNARNIPSFPFRLFALLCIVLQGFLSYILIHAYNHPDSTSKLDKIGQGINSSFNKTPTTPLALSCGCIIAVYLISQSLFRL